MPYRTTFVPFPYDRMARDGVDMTIRQVEDAARRDPARPVVLLGYSLGARIAGDAMVDLSWRFENMSAVLISDPRQPGTGIEIRRAGQLWPGVTFTGERGPIHAPVLRVSHARDPICSDAGLLGYFLHHSSYHRMRYRGGDLFSYLAQALDGVGEHNLVIR